MRREICVLKQYKTFSTMKKISLYLLLYLFFGLIFVSCNKELFPVDRYYISNVSTQDLFVSLNLASTEVTSIINDTSFYINSKDKIEISTMREPVSAKVISIDIYSKNKELLRHLNESEMKWEYQAEVDNTGYSANIDNHIFTITDEMIKRE